MSCWPGVQRSCAEASAVSLLIAAAGQAVLQPSAMPDVAKCGSRATCDGVSVLCWSPVLLEWRLRPFPTSSGIAPYQGCFYTAEEVVVLSSCSRVSECLLFWVALVAAPVGATGVVRGQRATVTH
jgi:hypothetical protein